MITPEEFAREMMKAKNMDRDDTEGAHGYADDIMVRVLREKGFGEAMDIYESMVKWYA